MKNKISQSTAAVETEPINLTVPIKGEAAGQFQTIKTQTGLSANTELGRLILLPALSLASKIGIPKFIQLMKDHEANIPANGTEASAP